MNFSDQLVNLSSAELAASAARLDMLGTFTHPRDSFDTGHVQLYLAKQRPGLRG